MPTWWTARSSSDHNNMNHNTNQLFSFESSKLTDQDPDNQAMSTKLIPGQVNDASTTSELLHKSTHVTTTPTTNATQIGTLGSFSSYYIQVLKQE